MRKWQHIIGAGLTFIWLVFIGQSALHPLFDHQADHHQHADCSAHQPVSDNSSDFDGTTLKDQNSSHCDVCDLLAALTSYLTVSAYASPLANYPQEISLPLALIYPAPFGPGQESRGPPAVL